MLARLEGPDGFTVRFETDPDSDPRAAALLDAEAESSRCMSALYHSSPRPDRPGRRHGELVSEHLTTRPASTLLDTLTPI